MDNQRPASDAEWYFSRIEGDEKRYNDIFFAMCRKYDVMWSKATPWEREFIAEMTRFTFQREKAKEQGLPLDSVAPVFVLR